MHDLVVVGAGFAGLACAKRAAERGLSVLVIDRQPFPGRYVHTTGILVKEAQAEWTAPGSLVRRLRRVRVYVPSLRWVEVGSDGYYFLATDTAKLMGFLAAETRRAGVDIRFGSEFVGVHGTRIGHRRSIQTAGRKGVLQSLRRGVVFEWATWPIGCDFDGAARAIAERTPTP